MPPRFIDRIVGGHVKVGQPITFRCKMMGVPTPTMSWQRDGKNLPQTENYQITIEVNRSFNTFLFAIF